MKLFFFHMHHKAAGSINCWERSCAADAVTPVCWSRKLEFVQNVDNTSTTLREGHHGIFNDEHLMLADGMPSLMSIQGTTAHALPVKLQDDSL